MLVGFKELVNDNKHQRLSAGVALPVGDAGDVLIIQLKCLVVVFKSLLKAAGFVGAVAFQALFRSLCFMLLFLNFLLRQLLLLLHQCGMLH